MFLHFLPKFLGEFVKTLTEDTMANGFLDIDTEHYKNGEIALDNVEVIQVYEIDENGKKGWLADLVIPHKLNLTKKQQKTSFKAKDGKVNFFAFFPEILKTAEEQAPINSVKDFGAVTVKITSKKELIFKLTYCWDGKKYYPAIFNKLIA